jgi:hypothetical protein
MHLYRSTRRDSPLSRHFFKLHSSLSVIRVLRLRSASEIRTAGLVGFRFLLDSGFHVADVTERMPPSSGCAQPEETTLLRLSVWLRATY